MSKLRFTISMSLDGFIAGPNQSVDNPLGVGGMRLHEWVFPLRPWRAMHGMQGGEVNESSRVVEESLAGLGATVMGRNMFGGHPGRPGRRFARAPARAHGRRVKGGAPKVRQAMRALQRARKGNACRIGYARGGDRPPRVGDAMMENTMQATKEGLRDASHLYEVERRAQHAARPGFRIQEIQLSKTQKVPWHYHNRVQDTFYVLEGEIRIFLQDPKEEVRLKPGETYTARARRPHLVTNGGEKSATFLVLQGIGEYDYVPLVEPRK